eukprot:gene28878-50781_t
MNPQPMPSPSEFLPGTVALVGAAPGDPELLTLSVEKLSALRGAAETVLDPRDFPGTWTQDDLALDVTYRFDPGAVDDGVLVHVPLAVLNRVRMDGFDWQVPGMREELVAALVKSLPKIYRKELSAEMDPAEVADAQRQARQWLAAGALFVAVGVDTMLLTSAAQNLLARFRTGADAAAPRPFTLSLSKRRARLRQACPEPVEGLSPNGFLLIEHKLQGSTSMKACIYGAGAIGGWLGV